LARLYAIAEPLPKAKKRLHALCQSLVPEKRAGDFAQALMDLGALICTPRRPACARCPLSMGCKARQLGITEELPRKAKKALRPLKRGVAFVTRDKDGAVLLVKRADKGLLGAMLQPPLGPWTDEFPSAREALLQAPFRAKWRKLAGVVRHGFTHFELEIEVYTTGVAARPKLARPEARWVSELGSVALPTVMKKIIDHAFKSEGPIAGGSENARGRRAV